MAKMVYTSESGKSTKQLSFFDHTLTMDEMKAMHLNIQIDNANHKELTNTDSNVQARVAKGETEGSTEC